MFNSMENFQPYETFSTVCNIVNSMHFFATFSTLCNIFNSMQHFQQYATFSANVTAGTKDRVFAKFEELRQLELEATLLENAEENGDY